MSTRCNIIIRKNDEVLHMYHHCDGYPEGVGAELLELSNMLKRDMTPSDVRDSIVYLYGDEYELTEGLHGDVEYVYEIRLNDNDAEIIFNKCVRKNPMRYSDYSLESIRTHTFPYIDSVVGGDTYTKGDLLCRKAHFTSDFTIDVKDSCVYREMPDGVALNVGKLMKLLIESHTTDIVENTKVEILQ